MKVWNPTGDRIVGKFDSIEYMFVPGKDCVECGCDSDRGCKKDTCASIMDIPESAARHITSTERQGSEGLIILDDAEAKQFASFDEYKEKRLKDALAARYDCNLRRLANYQDMVTDCAAVGSGEAIRFRDHIKWQAEVDEYEKKYLGAKAHKSMQATREVFEETRGNQRRVKRGRGRKQPKVAVQEPVTV